MTPSQRITLQVKQFACNWEDDPILKRALEEAILSLINEAVREAILLTHDALEEDGLNNINLRR